MKQLRLAILFLFVLFAYSTGVTLSDANMMVMESGLQRTVLETQEAGSLQEHVDLWAFGETPYELDNEKSVQIMNTRGIGSGYFYEVDGDTKLYTASHIIKPQNKDEIQLCNRSIDYSGSISKEVKHIDVRGVGVVDLEEVSVEHYDNDVAVIDIPDSRIDSEKFKIWQNKSYPVKGDTVSTDGHPQRDTQISNSGMEVIKNCENYMILDTNDIRGSGYTLSGMSGSPFFIEESNTGNNGIAGVFTSASNDYLFLSKMP